MLGTFHEEYEKIKEEYHSRAKICLLAELEKTDKNIVIFAVGTVGRHLATKLQDKMSDRLVAFCDNFKTGHNEQFNIPIITPKTLASEYKSAIVIVAVTAEYSDEIFNQVRELGFHPDSILRHYSLYSGFDTLETLEEHYEGYQWAFNFFEDDISKQIVLNRIRAYLFACSMEHSPYKDQYFESDVMPLSDNEVFLDCGCYTGDTALEFIDRTNGKFSYIYSFEPDVANYEIAKKNLAGYKNIEIVNKGVWNKDDILCFNSLGTSGSQIVENAVTKIVVTKLDDFLKDKHIPTLIKMDIEGAEENALLGLAETIKTHRPKLAIGAYHRYQDIYVLTKLIKDLVNDYSFNLRHYTGGIGETVLYARL